MRPFYHCGQNKVARPLLSASYSTLDVEFTAEFTYIPVSEGLLCLLCNFFLLYKNTRYITQANPFLYLIPSVLAFLLSNWIPNMFFFFSFFIISTYILENHPRCVKAFCLNFFALYNFFPLPFNYWYECRHFVVLSNFDILKKWIKRSTVKAVYYHRNILYAWNKSK